MSELRDRKEKSELEGFTFKPSTAKPGKGDLTKRVVIKGGISI